MEEDVAIRLRALEERTAHQEHLLAQLDDVVREFTKRVEVLERSLEEVIATIGNPEEIGPANSPPPHY